MTSLPLLPLRDIVVFPGMVVPLFVGRDKSVAALEAAMEGNKDIFLLAQLDPGCDDPDRDDLYDMGVIASVHSFTQSGVGYFFLAFLVGMTTMFLLGLRHDLRVRRALREAGFGEPIAAEEVAPRWEEDDDEGTSAVISVATAALIISAVAVRCTCGPAGGSARRTAPTPSATASSIRCG